VLCAPRQPLGTLWYTESSDAGMHFGPLEAVPISSDATVQLALADGGAVALVASSGANAPGQVFRSTDRGRGWDNVLSSPSPGPSGVTPWLGFEDDTTGRVTFGDTSLWSTDDAGATWSQEQVPSNL
jgi:photosystem II stability/assembly factor-like uncharacterized protein